ncbi:5648_t:CDS:2, partial [Acaulospora colombiana]
TTPARKSPSRSSNKLIHRHLLDDDDENPNVVSQGHAAATNSNVDLTVRQERESRDVVVFWRGVIHFNIPLSRVKRTNNKQASNDYDDEGEETTNNNTQPEGGSPSSNQGHDYYDHDGPLSRLTPHGVDLVRAHAQSRGVSISNGFSLLVQGTVSHYEFVWGTPQTLGTSGPSTKTGKTGTSRGDASTFPSVNATDRVSASRDGGVQNTMASSSSPRVKRRQNESGVLHTTNKNNLFLYSVVPCSHGCTRTYLVESLDEFAQLDSRETQRHDALIAWMRAMKQGAPNSTWAKDYSWYVNRYMEDFPHMVKVGEQSDRRGPEAITDPKYRKMIREERLIRKKEVDDVLREQQQMKRQGFALQQLLSSLDATTDDQPLPPRNPSILHSIIGGSQPDSEGNHWMEDSAAPSSNYTRYATAVDVEETKA